MRPMHRGAKDSRIFPFFFFKHKTAYEIRPRDWSSRRVLFRSLHFDLSHSPPGVVHTLHLGGKKYTLAPHTPQTRAALREKNRLLQNVPDARLTHHLVDVPVLSGA